MRECFTDILISRNNHYASKKDAYYITLFTNIDSRVFLDLQNPSILQPRIKFECTYLKLNNSPAFLKSWAAKKPSTRRMEILLRMRALRAFMLTSATMIGVNALSFSLTSSNSGSSIFSFIMSLADRQRLSAGQQCISLLPQQYYYSNRPTRWGSVQMCAFRIYCVHSYVWTNLTKTLADTILQ